jgi:hypothetical protein
MWEDAASKTSNLVSRMVVPFRQRYFGQEFATVAGLTVLVTMCLCDVSLQGCDLEWVDGLSVETSYPAWWLNIVGETN